MYNGGFGYGGAGGMGGQEMMIMLVCCVCCVCILSIVGGYFTNIFCSVSNKLGRSCEPTTPAPTTGPITPETVQPEEPTSSVKACSEAYGRVARGKNDPRPSIRADYCRNETRVVGKDCYYWQVQSDPVTGQGRWMRLTDPDDPKGDMRSGGTCEPSVRCPTTFDPASLEGYSDTNPQPLLKQCTGIAATATTKDATIAEITKAARGVSRTWTGTEAWGDVHSRIWYEKMARYLGQRDMITYIGNATKAARRVMEKMNSTVIKKSTFAYILEASIRSPDNRADWIIDTTNAWYNKVAPPGRTEGGFVRYLRGVIVRPPLVPWETTIDNPQYYR